MHCDHTLGADDVITVDTNAEDRFTNEQHILFKELSIRPEYDVIFYTTTADYDTEFMHTFLTPHGRLVSTVEQTPASDSCGFFGRFALSVRTIQIDLKVTRQMSSDLL